ncbi:MAG: ribosome silencing factor [Leptolyngbyaceae cyanobacterium SM2_3_12]|nr:ribosome silencing factor [Leptolyngbyaceae cyanobacterium SM2_3_12]
MTNSQNLPVPTTSEAAFSGVSAGDEDTALQLAYAVAAAAEERKGSDIRILQVGDVSYLADYFVLVTGFSAVQVRAITRSIEATLEDDWNRRPLRVEGQMEGNWVLLDYGEVIVHVFMPEAREFYDLEAFWGHANQIAYRSSLP